MPPRKQVYGKPSHLYSSLNGFQSPVKARKQESAFKVIEVSEELARLTVHTEFTAHDDQNASPVRQPLGERNANTDRQPVRPLIQRTTSQPVRRERSLKSKAPKPARVKSKDAEPVQVKSKDAEPVHAKSEEALPATANSDDAPPATVKSKDAQEEVQAEPQPLDNNHKEPELAQSPIRIESANQPEVISEPMNPVDSIEANLAALDISKPTISNVFTKHASSLLSLSSQDLMSFSAWSDQLSSHFAVTKIAEASFGEVYRLALLKSHSSLTKSDESVLKIIALKPPPSTKRKMSKAAKKRTEMMSDPQDVAAEVRLMQRMTCTPGFTNFREICILQGRPGDAFASAWSSWNDSQKSKGKETSVFPDPSKEPSYSEDQLWAVIEMQDAGTDLENTKIGNVWLAWDIFWGVVLALGKGEEAAKFEHRDLHMGNICVSGLDQAVQNLVDFTPATTDKTLGFTGIETTIIDYTISRAEMGVIKGPENEEDVAYLDLEKDLSLFEGDADEEYQYEVYRHMRSAMYLGDPLGDLWERWDEAESSGRTWRGYHPQTNLVWLHFVLHKLAEQIEWPSSNASVGDDQAAHKAHKAQYLEAALLKITQLLDPEGMPHSGLRSASDLVVLALDEGWLEKEDVQGRKVSVTKTLKRKAKTGRTKKSQR